MSKPSETKVYYDIHKLAEHIECIRNLHRTTLRYGRPPHYKTVTYDDKKVIAASGGFDPLHMGHLQYIREAALISEEGTHANPDSILIVIVNSDEWLMRKKGYVFMKLEERLNIVAAIEGVDYAIVWDDGGPTVSGALEILKPNYFAKGGDRDAPEKIPEFEACEKIKCEVVFGVGGGKIQSSSELVKRYKELEK